MTSIRRFLLGIDLAKSLDYTSFAIIEMIWTVESQEWRYHLVALDRIKGVDYPKIVELIIATINKLEELDIKIGHAFDGPHLCLDASGLGAPIKDFLKEKHVFQQGKEFYPVVFTGGEAARRDPKTQNYNISKSLMYSNFLSLMQHKRFDYASDLQALPLLEDEIINFKYHMSASGHASMDAAQGKHDDLLTSIVIPCAIGEFYLKFQVI
jgi:hypothetical protein